MHSYHLKVLKALRKTSPVYGVVGGDCCGTVLKKKKYVEIYNKISHEPSMNSIFIVYNRISK